jgi:hypothetical protein
MTDDELDQLRRALDDYDLATAPPQTVASLPFSPDAKAILLRVGLPRREVVPGMAFDLVDVLPKPVEVVGYEDFKFSPAWDPVRMLGTVQSGGFFTNLADGGSIWLTPDFASPNETLFVNTDAVALARSLAVFATLEPVPETASREQRLRALAELQARLRAIDDEALDGAANNYWPLMLEDAETFG